MTAIHHAPAVFDRAEALERIDGDEELLRALAGLFLRECPKLMAEIRTGTASGEPDRVAHAAHTLKGSVGHLASRAVVAAAERVEALAQDRDVAGLGAGVEALERAVDRLLEALAGDFGGVP